MSRTVSTEAAFWRLVDVREMPECWRWRGTRMGNYGAFRANGEQVMAHRFAWAFAYGSIPAGAMVLHCCDNTECVNPRHLRLGTHEGNNLDKSVLTRVRSVLAEATAIENAADATPRAVAPSLPPFGTAIRRLRESRGLNQKSFAKAIGVAPSLVCYWEKGVCGTTLARVKAIAEQFGVDMQELLA